MKRIHMPETIDVVKNAPDHYLTMELETLSEPNWWLVNATNEYYENYWSNYYNQLEEEAIKRGLV